MICPWHTTPRPRCVPCILDGLTRRVVALEGMKMHGDGNASMTRWFWLDAPQWVREMAPLNGDDVDWVVLFSPKHYLTAGGLPRGASDTVICWCPKGILVFGFHA